MKTNIKRYMVFFMFFILLVFSINLISNTNIYAASGGSSGGGSASFGDNNSSSNQTENQQKTGKNVNNVKNLGENTLKNEKTDNVLNHLGVNGGTGTEGSKEHRYDKFNKALYKIWGVILVVLQVASMSGIIFAGVRYMFASVDSKADMKKSMIYLVIGMVIVFAASSVVGFVTGTFDEIFKELK